MSGSRPLTCTRIAAVKPHAVCKRPAPALASVLVLVLALAPAPLPPLLAAAVAVPGVCNNVLGAKNGAAK